MISQELAQVMAFQEITQTQLDYAIDSYRDEGEISHLDWRIQSDLPLFTGVFYRGIRIEFQYGADNGGFGPGVVLAD